MLITLTTDFGTQDGYVAAMKGVLSSLAPGVPLVDITHAIPPQDVRSAAYVLWTAVPYFPAESVHLVVVDPGVGTARHPIAVRTLWGTLVGPDNGVFSYLWAVAPSDLVVIVEESKYRLPVVSSTFHGRDIFAPAAAYVAGSAGSPGVPLEALGPPLEAPVCLPLPRLTLEPGRIQGEILYVDRFGNAITSIGRLHWQGEQLHLEAAFPPAQHAPIPATRARVVLKGRDLGPVRHTYAESAPGAALALVGSEGMLELAVNQGHGATALGVAVGDVVDLVFG